MSSRVRRSLTNIESLLLAQAVWELGAAPESWVDIAKILSKHPLLSRPKSFFSSQSCHSMYESLMKDASLELDESNNSPHAPANLQLAQKHYRSRFLELQGLILAEESKFKTVLREIEDIRAGLWDNDIEAKNSSELMIDVPQEPTITTPLLHGKPADELYNNSDLTECTSLPASTILQGDSVSLATPAEDKKQRAPPMDDDEHAQIVTSMNTSPLSPIPQDVTRDTLEKFSDDAEPASEVDQATNGQLKASTFSTSSSEEVVVEDNAVKQTTEEDEIKTVGVQDTPESFPENADIIGIHNEPPREEAKELLEESQEPNGKSQLNELELDGREMGTDVDGPMEILQVTQEAREPNSPKSCQIFDMETESEPVHTPAAETVASEPDLVTNDGLCSETEDHVVPTRRSTRRRKSSTASVPPPQTRTRLRSQARVSGTEPPPTADSENDGDAEVKEDTPTVDDEHVSSPFDRATTRRRDGKRKASFLEPGGSPHDKKRLREDSEPIDEEEPGPSSHSARTRVTRHATKTEEQVALKRFQNVIGMLHSQISQHRNGNIFHNPIKNSEAPDYHEFVKRPMDLKTIKTRVKDGIIANSLEFQRDIYLMFANAMMYNRPGSDVYAMAEDMMLESEGQIIAFRQTEGLVKRGQRP